MSIMKMMVVIIMNMTMTRKRRDRSRIASLFLSYSTAVKTDQQVTVFNAHSTMKVTSGSEINSEAKHFHTHTKNPEIIGPTLSSSDRFHQSIGSCPTCPRTFFCFCFCFEVAVWTEICFLQTCMSTFRHAVCAPLASSESGN